ncbi:MAG: replication factor C large subunit, partial [Methanobacterium sp.]
KSKNPRRIKDAMKVDAEPSFILELLAENIPKEYEKVNELQNAYEMISLADIYLGRAFNTRVYTYWKYTYELMSLGVALSKDETYRKFSRFTNSSIFSMLSKSRGKRDLKDRVAEKMGEKLHSSKKVVKEQFPYMEIMFKNNETAYDLATYYGLTDDEVKLFRSRKIKVKKTKVKKQDTSEIKSKETSNNLKSKPKKPASQSEVTTNLKVKKPLKSDKKQTERKIKGSNKEKSDEKKSDNKDKDKSQTSLFSF